MTISAELEAKILRYFHVEKWPVGTIARQLGLHHGTVDRVLSQAGLPKLERPHRASLARSVPALRAGHLGTVPAAVRQSALCHGARARLPGWRGSLPSPAAALPATGAARGLPAPEDPAGGAGPSRLGPFRHRDRRPCHAPADGVRDGAELVAADPAALLYGCPHGQLSARSCGGLPGLGRAAAGAALRQSEKRRAGTSGRRHSVSSHRAGLGRPLSLRAAAGRSRPRE